MRLNKGDIVRFDDSIPNYYSSKGMCFPDSPYLTWFDRVIKKKKPNFFICTYKNGNITNHYKLKNGDIFVVDAYVARTLCLVPFNSDIPFDYYFTFLCDNFIKLSPKEIRRIKLKKLQSY